MTGHFIVYVGHIPLAVFKVSSPINWSMAGHTFDLSVVVSLRDQVGSLYSEVYL